MLNDPRPYYAGAIAAADILAHVYGVRVAKALDPNDPDDFNVIVAQLSAKLQGLSGPAQIAAIKTALAQLDVDWNTISGAQVDKVLKQTNKILAKAPIPLPKIEATIRTSAADTARASAESTKEKYSFKIEGSFDKEATEAADIAAQNLAAYVTNQQGEIAEGASKLARKIVAKGIREGVTNGEIAKRLRAELAPYALGRSHAYYTMVAGVHLNRARTHGILSGMNRGGISEYKFVAVRDELTTPQCRFLHGKTFPVKAALARMKSTSAGADVKQAMPWIQYGNGPDKTKILYYKDGQGQRQTVATVEHSGIGEVDGPGSFTPKIDHAGLIALGLTLPPLHGHCRSTIVPAFGMTVTVPDSLLDDLADLDQYDNPLDEEPDLGGFADGLGAEGDTAGGFGLPRETDPLSPTRSPAIPQPQTAPRTPGYAPVRLPRPPVTTPVKVPAGLDDPKGLVQFVKGTPEQDEDLLGIELNGVAFTPTDKHAWKKHKDLDLGEPPLPKHPYKKNSAGVLIVEPDGRVWIYEPKNHYGGYQQSFPKGGLEGGSAQQAAIREAMEEAGLNVELVSYLGDFEGDTTSTRYYVARRTGGTPVGHDGKETDSVTVLTLDDAEKKLNKKRDKDVLAAYQKAIAPNVTPVKPPAVVAATPPPIPVVDPPPVAFSMAEPSTAAEFMAQRIGPQAGSNEGGLYLGSDGKKRYVKIYNSASQAAQEVTANDVYALLKVKAPTAKTFTLPDGRVGYASEIIEGKALGVVPLTKPIAKDFSKGFVADVLLGNWDAVGMSLDNVLVNGAKVARIDNGGSFLLRAQGGRKPAAVLGQIGEWDTFFNHSIAPQYSKVLRAAGYSKPEDFAKDVVRQIKAAEKALPKILKTIDKNMKGVSELDRIAMRDMVTKRMGLLQQKRGELEQRIANPNFVPVMPGYGNLGAANTPERLKSKDGGYLPSPKGMVDPVGISRFEDIPKNVPRLTGIPARQHGDLLNGLPNAELRKNQDAVTDHFRKNPAAMQAQAQAQYTGNAYGTIRRAEADLMHGKTPDPYGLKLSNDITGALESAPKLHVTTYRGIPGITRETVDYLLKSDVIRLGKMDTGCTTSSSTNPDVATNFMHGWGEGGYDQYKVYYVIRNRSGAYVEGITSNRTETEVLLPRSAKYRRVSVGRPSGQERTLVIELEEIEDP